MVRISSESSEYRQNIVRISLLIFRGCSSKLIIPKHRIQYRAAFSTPAFGRKGMMKLLERGVLEALPPDLDVFLRHPIGANNC